MKQIIIILKEKLWCIYYSLGMLSLVITVSLQSQGQNGIAVNSTFTGKNNNQISAPKLCNSYTTIDAAALKEAKDFEALNTNSLLPTSYTIRIYFHICTDNNGSNAAATELQIKAELNNLISDYAPYNMCFVNMGLNYIYSTALNQMSTINSSLLTPYLVPNCINIFYHRMVGTAGGTAYSIPNTFCSIDDGNIGTGHTISHEVGHCFGLLHTFEPSTGYENINGSNSSSAADQITDTPADPYAYKGNTCYSASSCSYTGNCTDPNGASNFSPPYTNTMAYWPVIFSVCYGTPSFTSGQFTRINSYLSTNCSLQACESASYVTFGPVTYSSGYHMQSAINTLTTSGTVELNGTTTITLGGALVSLQPGFHADGYAGALIMIRPSLCSPVIPRESSEQQIITEIEFDSELKCFPNPFTDQIKIEFNLSKDDNASINIIDVTGREVKEISNSYLAEGIHDLTIDSSDLPPGIYFVVLQGSDFRKDQKIVKVH